MRPNDILGELQAEKIVLIRGALMQASSIVEYSLVRLIIFSFLEETQRCKDNNLPEPEPYEFSRLTFSSKRDMAIKYLKKYHFDIYKKYTDTFSQLIELNASRNELAHGTVYWDNDSVMEFTVWVIDKIDGHQYYVPKKMTMEQANEIIQRFTLVFIEMCKMSIEVNNAVRVKFPFAVSASPENPGYFG